MAPRRVVLDAVVGEPRRCRDRQALVDARDRIQRHRLSCRRIPRSASTPGSTAMPSGSVGSSPTATTSIATESTSRPKAPISRSRRRYCPRACSSPIPISAPRKSISGRWKPRFPTPASTPAPIPCRSKSPIKACAEAGLCYPPITKVLFPEHAASAVVSASHPWVGVAILAGGFCLSIGGIDTAQGTQARTPRGMKTSIPRIAAAAALVVLGIWAGAWVYSTHSAAPRHHGGPGTCGRCQRPQSQRFGARRRGTSGRCPG